VTGYNFKKGTGMLLGRITGLDPSGLQYHYTAMSEKLDKSDATFVDVIHTTTSPFGIGTSIGHVDFYVRHCIHDIKRIASMNFT
jgi:hypothetical protein